MQKRYQWVQPPVCLPHACLFLCLSGPCVSAPPAYHQRLVHGDCRRCVWQVGKGISCSNALSDLGHAGDTAVLVLCGAADTALYQSALAPHTFGQVQVLGGPPQTRRHVTIIVSAATALHVVEADRCWAAG
jgi:hypothetical protein|eukprot:SAG25_NODE_1643_length_2629_cov_2.731621_1_plen_131_part_00